MSNQQRTSSIMDYLRSDYVNTGLFLSRAGTILCCIAFLLSPIFFSSNPSDIDSWYRRALLSCAVSSALRLHQRMKTVNIGFSMALFEMLMFEDSFHYLVYSIMFALLAPVTVSLVPIFLFAVLHVTSFTQILLNLSGPASDNASGNSAPSRLPYVQTLLIKVKENEQTVLRVIALNEIMLMVICIFMALSGPKIILLPFMYYPFLKMRYNSRKNPYSKYAFNELRIAFQQLACHSKCPNLISRIIYGAISFISRLGSTSYGRS